MRKINERSLIKKFLENSYSKGIKYSCSCGNCPMCRTQKRMIKENMMPIGGIGFGGSHNNGFSSHYVDNFDDSSYGEDHAPWEESNLDGSSFGEDHEPWEESMNEPHNFSVDQWGEHSYQPGDNYDTSHMNFDELEDCGCSDEEDYEFDCGCDDQEGESQYYGEPGAARDEPETDAYGNLTPQSLYNHFDLNGDGKVDMGEYAAHVNFHCRHPELLDQYEDIKSYSSSQCHDAESYNCVGDSLMEDYDDVILSLQPIMKKTGASCPASAAKAISDVLSMLKDAGLL